MSTDLLVRCLLRYGWQVRQIQGLTLNRFCTNLRMSHLRLRRSLICRQIHHKSTDVVSDRKVPWSKTRTTFLPNKANTDLLQCHQGNIRLHKDHFSQMGQTVLERWENSWTKKNTKKEKVRFSKLSQNRSWVHLRRVDSLNHVVLWAQLSQSNLAFPTTLIGKVISLWLLKSHRSRNRKAVRNQRTKLME